MKSLVRNLLFAAALTPLITSCATQDEVQRLRYQLHTVNKKLAEMESSTVGDIQKQQAASSNQMEMLEREILILKGQLEETNMQNQMLQQQNDALQSNLTSVAKEEAERREEALQRIAAEQKEKETLIVELNEKLKAQEESLQAIQDARVRDAERRAQDAKIKADAAKARALAASSSSSSGGIIHISIDKKKRVIGKPGVSTPVNQTTSSKQPKKQSQPTPKTVVASPSEPQQETKPTQVVSKPAATKTEPAPTPTPELKGIDAAQDLYTQKQYSSAYTKFEQVFSANPTSSDGVTASFMMGECLYFQNEYDKAILQYQKFISQNSTHPSASTATFRQGQAFEKLADAETAKMIYKKLVNHYSNSAEAKDAQARLDAL